ncbi:MAG: hypothetical protein JKX71_08180 [Amylibacter sp.]|nr:hypothetical protein [Amylibacter sp.]
MIRKAIDGLRQRSGPQRSIHPNPKEQETFLVVKSTDRKDARDIQIKLRPNKIVLRRDQGAA